MTKVWSDEETEYLEMNYGKRTIFKISVDLNRSECAIASKAFRLGVSQKDNANWYPLSEFCDLSGIHRSTVQYWIDECGFPVTKSKALAKKYVRLYPSKFWEWAKDNKHRIQWSEFPNYVFEKEPKWVDEIRLANKKSVNKRRKWSESELTELKRLLNLEKYTYPELTDKLNRSQGAIKRKIYDLMLPLPVYVNRGAIAEYTKEEVDKAVDLYEQGYPMHEIAKKLGRTEMGLRGKIERSGYRIIGKRMEVV